MAKETEKINVLNLIGAILMWIIVAAWTFLIFKLSSENAFASYARSLDFANLFFRWTGIELTQTIVRKGAIIGEFALLSFSVYFGMVYTNGISEKYSFAASPIKLVKHSNELCILYALWITIFIAALNEYFQLFVEGRDATITDIGFAAASAVVVLAICRMCFLIRLKLENKEEIDYQ